MESGRHLRSRTVPSPTKSPRKALEIDSTKKPVGKSGGKPKAKTPAAPKTVVASNSLRQAQDFIAKPSTRDANVSKRAKRGREEEEEDENAALEIAAHEMTESYMREDAYALEIERRQEKIIASIARYEPMIALAKKSLSGEPLKDKLIEIKNKLANLEEELVACNALRDRRYDEIFRDTLESSKKRPSKRPRIESTLSESEDLDVSDSK
jgi:hypothetical protein